MMRVMSSTDPCLQLFALDYQLKLICLFKSAVKFSTSNFYTLGCLPIPARTNLLFIKIFLNLVDLWADNHRDLFEGLNN